MKFSKNRFFKMAEIQEVGLSNFVICTKEINIVKYTHLEVILTLMVVYMNMAFCVIYYLVY